MHTLATIKALTYLDAVKFGDLCLLQKQRSFTNYAGYTCEIKPLDP